MSQATPQPQHTAPAHAESANSSGDLLQISPPPRKPTLPGHVVLRETVDELVDAMAAELMLHAGNCVRVFGDFHIAVSGGSTPEPFYRRLMIDPRYRDLPWQRVHLWIVDERCVPFDDDRSNFKMIREILVDHSDIPPDQVHPMFAMSETGDIEYEKTLREVLSWRERGQDRLDYVLLGMGDDGHTASLFPNSPALDADPSRLVCMNSGPTVKPPDRLTMTLRMINAARFIALMVTGAKKCAMIKRVASRRDSVRDLPVLGVQPIGGELRWYLDNAACSGGAGHADNSASGAT